MADPKFNYFISILMIITFLFVVITSWIIGDDGGTRVINKIHHEAGIVLLVLIGLHILLHIKFIVAMTKEIFTKKIKNKE